MKMFVAISVRLTSPNLSLDQKLSFELFKFANHLRLLLLLDALSSSTLLRFLVTQPKVRMRLARMLWEMILRHLMHTLYKELDESYWWWPHRGPCGGGATW